MAGLNGTQLPTSLDQIMAQIGSQSPEQAQKLELLSQLIGSAEHKADDSPDRSRKRQRLRRRIARLQREHRQLKKRSELLAEALGACYCWGENPRCRTCRGQGGPGAMAPAPEAFEAFIMPALEAAGLIQMTEAAPGAPSERHGLLEQSIEADPTKGE